MIELSFKNKLVYHVGEFMAALLLVQPLLDVLSFCFAGSAATIITTALRMALLITVSLYGFVITDRRDIYYACYGLIAAFWLLHVLNCIRLGYQHPISDLTEYCKLIQLPLWTLSFITFFRIRDNLDIDMLSVMVANLVIIFVVIGLSYLTGTQVYTYEFPEREIQIGVMGWFPIHNTQSAILCMIIPAVLLWGLRTEKLAVFSACAVFGLGLLYFTGTRLAYYTAILLTLAFVVIIVLCRKPMLFCLPMLVSLILLIAFKGVSPMNERQEVSSTSFSVYQEKIDKIMGEDKDFVYKKNKETDPKVMKKIEKVYTDIYGKHGVYDEVLLGDLIERFGVEKVMEEFDYTIKPQVLNDLRKRKLIAMSMLWEEQDFLTHLLGMECTASKIGEKSYDPENDFPALPYMYGYIGVLLYLAFFAGVIFFAATEFIRRFPTLLNPEFITAAIILVLGLGAAQFSGQVLRRTSATVYISLAAATLFVQAEQTPSIARLRYGHKRNPAVYLKKIG